MTKSVFLIWIASLCIFASIAALVAMTIVLWPFGWGLGLLLASLYFLPAITTVIFLQRRRASLAPWNLDADAIVGMSDAELAGFQLQALTDYERRLEFRELRLARQIRTAQYSNPDYLDLRQANPSDEELDALVQNDRKLVALIEQESQLAFNRILSNRYAAADGVNNVLIFQDIREFIEKVARLYRPDSNDILLETEIELIAKSFSSVSLHLLMVVADLPLNLKSYNTAKKYRLIRRGVSYYGTYKAFRPYLEHGLNAFQLARLALGMNPVAVGTAWLAGKLSTHGAKAVGERLLQRKSLQLLNDFIRVIGFEAAMMYGGDFAHRDTNWVFGAALANLEISRGKDLAGRDAAVQGLCSLVLRNEFDRIHLLNQIARGKPVDLAKARPLIIMTSRERADIVAMLAKHCAATGVDLGTPEFKRWQEKLEALLEIPFLPEQPAAQRDAPSPGVSRLERIKRRLRSFRGSKRKTPDKQPDHDDRNS
jgi:hypothetical protein